MRTMLIASTLCIIGAGTFILGISAASGADSRFVQLASEGASKVFGADGAADQDEDYLCMEAQADWETNEHGWPTFPSTGCPGVGEDDPPCVRCTSSAQSVKLGDVDDHVTGWVPTNPQSYATCGQRIVGDCVLNFCLNQAISGDCRPLEIYLEQKVGGGN